MSSHRHAGASAVRQYESRLAGHGAERTTRIREAQAWRGPARTEDPLHGVPGIVELHDRPVPGSRASIDHIAVTPTGVWVIDAKRYGGRSVACREGAGLLRRDRRLLVDGRDETRLVEAMSGPVGAVVEAAGNLLDGVVVRPALCFTESSWGLHPKPFLVKDVVVCWPKALQRILSRPGDLDDLRVRDIAAVLAHRLRPT
jgi:hypothetical protein